MTSPAPVRLPIPSGRQLTLRLSQDGQDAAIVLGFRGAGSWTGDEVAPIVRDAAWNAFRPLILTNVVLVSAIWRDVSVADGPVVEVGPSANATGLAGGTASIAAATTLLRWTTGGGGRSGRGRTYLPGLATVSVQADGRRYTASYAGTVASAISTYLGSAALSGQGLAPAVLSFTKGVARPILAGSLSPVVGVQRRRMR